MRDEKDEIAFISYLDERNLKREGYFEIVNFDASFVKFKTHGNIIIIPTSRVLKIKYKEVGDDNQR